MEIEIINQINIRKNNNNIKKKKNMQFLNPTLKDFKEKRKFFVLKRFYFFETFYSSSFA